MNPSPEQIAEWFKQGAATFLKDKHAATFNTPDYFYASGYLRARTEQATEIAAPFRPITTDIKMLTDDEAFDVECNSYANTAKAIQQAFCAKNNINLGAKK